MLYARWREGNSVTVSPLDEQAWLRKSFYTHRGEDVTVDTLLTSIPAPSSRMRVTFDRPTTAAAVAACKSRGIRVTSAVHAAIVQAVAAHPQHPQPKHYCITTAIDLWCRLPGGTERGRA
jgi:hypothetical protein